MDSLRLLIGNNNNSDGYFGIFGEDDDNTFTKYFELSLKNRIYGFGICVALGLLFSLLGIIALFFVKLTTFAVLYSFGNIISIIGVCFLISPMKQLKNMFQLHRLIATLVFLISIILTLLSAFYWQKAILCMVFFIVQFLAYFWYCLSYIPYARTLCCKLGGSFVDGIV